MTHPDIPDEQAYFDTLYARLDDELEHTRRRLEEVRLESVGGHHQSRQERDAFAQHLEDRLDGLKVHQRDDLCFGRIDLADGQRFYIGRMGLADEELEPLLMDWRAPAAAPFYQATPMAPMNVVRRRHFMTRDRRIVAIEDEVLDADRLAADEAVDLRGEAALQYAMNTARTGRMREIAATIQREQDQIIRASMTPAVFVQGGPGTGKTAVALHRAAYLLYTYQRQLSARDVLVVGPSPLFLRYIENVLPSLGENGAALTSIPEVYRRRAWVDDDPARGLKARPVMVDVIARAIAVRERPLPRAMEVTVAGRSARISRADTQGIVTSARNRPGLHNVKALGVHERLLRMVCRRLKKAGLRWEFDHIKEEVWDRRDFRRLAMRVWPVFTAEELLGATFGFPALLREATDGLLDAEEVALLGRAWNSDARTPAWTRSDAALLDEAAAQLGPIPPELDPALRSSSEFDDEDAAAEAHYLRQSLRGLGGGLVPREVLAERLGGRTATRSDDDDVDGRRAWRYAVIDEAQDLSPMEWRMIGRHASRRALTVVGDVAQGTEAWSSGSWAEIGGSLGTGEEATLTELTINYRTPSEVADLAARVLERVDPTLQPPTAIRSAPGSLTSERVEAGAIAARAAEVAIGLREEIDAGIACVISPHGLLGAVRSAIEEQVGAPVPDPTDPDILDAPVVAMAPEHAKGLEFDVVVIADPAGVVAERSWRDLYVGLTRTTQRLALVHSTPDPIPDL